MNFIDNDPKQVAIRKYQNTLIVVGTVIYLAAILRIAGAFRRTDIVYIQ